MQIFIARSSTLLDDSCQCASQYLCLSGSSDSFRVDGSSVWYLALATWLVLSAAGSLSLPSQSPECGAKLGVAGDR